MIELDNVTLVCIDCINYHSAIKAILKSIEKIKFKQVLFITDKLFFLDDFETVTIDKITSKEQYSNFIIKKLHMHINTEHCIIMQYDGYIINPDLWDESFLIYDYIGASWWYDENNVGNGGFSLRSKKLLEIVSNFEFKKPHPEDDAICREARYELEHRFGIRFAPENIAELFSFEPNRLGKPFKNNSFGFHGLPHLIL